jgi:hypothetical protein
VGVPLSCRAGFDTWFLANKGGGIRLEAECMAFVLEQEAVACKGIWAAEGSW